MKNGITLGQFSREQIGMLLDGLIVLEARSLKDEERCNALHTIHTQIAGRLKELPQSKPTYHCAYCGLEKGTLSLCCQKKYRPGKKRADGLNDGVVVTCECTTAETTLAGFIDSIYETFPISSQKPESVKGIWKWSFSEGKGKE